MLLAGLGCPEPAPSCTTLGWVLLLAWGGGELPSLPPIKSPWYLCPVSILLFAPTHTLNPATGLSLGGALG